MGINVRNKKLTDSTTEALNSLSKKRTVILTDRKQTALDTDSVNDKLTSTIIEYVKETNKGNNFVFTIDIEDKKTVFKLRLDSDLHLTKSISSNLFGYKPNVLISKINDNLASLKKLRSTIKIDDVGAASSNPFAVSTAPFELDLENKEIMPLVMVNIQTRTKYF